MASFLDLAEYKTYAAITSTNQDAQLQVILDGVEGYVLNFMGVPNPILGTVPYYYDKQYQVFVDAIPNVASPVIKYAPKGSVLGGEADIIEVLDTDLYIYDLQSGLITILQPGLDLIADVSPAIKVEENVSGYLMPSAVKLASFELTKLWAKEKFVQSKAQRGESVANFNTGTEVPPQIQAILMKYRAF